MHIIILEEFYCIHVLRIHVLYFLHSVMMSSSAFSLCMCVCMLETCGGRKSNASVQVYRYTTMDKCMYIVCMHQYLLAVA